MIEFTLSGVNWLVCLKSWKQINKCTEGICLYEILCDKMEMPKKWKRTFILDLKINVINDPTSSEKKCLNKEHINIHRLIQRFYVDISITAILMLLNVKYE